MPTRPLSLDILTEEQKMQLFDTGENYKNYENSLIDKIEPSDNTGLKIIEGQPEHNKLVIILQKVKDSIDVTQEESNFLDSIDSILLGHNIFTNFTQRETVCYFLLHKFPMWDAIFNKVPLTNKIYYATDLYKEYKKTLKDREFENFHFKRKQIMKYTDFMKFMKHHALFMPRDKGKDVNGNRNKRDYFYNLPVEWKDINTK